MHAIHQERDDIEELINTEHTLYIYVCVIAIGNKTIH